VVDAVAGKPRAQRLVAADHARLLGEDGVERHAGIDEACRAAVPSSAEKFADANSGG
jgi:hypothetical protein